jgi:hypothetical protein
MIKSNDVAEKGLGMLKTRKKTFTSAPINIRNIMLSPTVYNRVLIGLIPFSLNNLSKRKPGTNVR